MVVGPRMVVLQVQKQAQEVVLEDHHGGRHPSDAV